MSTASFGTPSRTHHRFANYATKRKVTSRMEMRVQCSSRLPISKISLGTMLFGEQTSCSEAYDLMNVAYENGVNLFDTAEMYPVPQNAKTQGISETIIGKWLKGKPRDQVFISTKVTGPSGVMTWIRNGPKALNGQSIRDAIEGTLKRLQTDYVDIYSIHWPDRYVPMFGDTDYDPVNAYQYASFEEQYEALKDCATEGKVRCIGLSNETPFGLMKFTQLAKTGPNSSQIYSIQNAYSLLNRAFDASLAECCNEEDIRLHAYAPLAAGLLTGKYLKGCAERSRFHIYNGRFAEMEYRYQSKPNIDKAVAEYAALAESAGMTLTEMALRFALHRPLIETVITGCTTIEQLKENVAYATMGPLGSDVTAKIDELHLRYPNPAP